jgi:hypothetical protein
VFAYQHAHGLNLDRLLRADLVIRHRCDEASCQNPTHLVIGTAADNSTDYQARRYRAGGPLADVRGAGRARAIRHAIKTAPTGPPPAVEEAIMAAIRAGDAHRDQPVLFPGFF